MNGRFAGAIDFYFACWDVLAYDIAVALNAWCFEPDGGFNITAAGALIDGYQRRRTLSAAELAALPILAHGAAMRFFLTRLHDWGATPPRVRWCGPRTPWSTSAGSPRIGPAFSCWRRK